VFRNVQRDIFREVIIVFLVGGIVRSVKIKLKMVFVRVVKKIIIFGRVFVILVVRVLIRLWREIVLVG
jgi:hypothetical protein